MIIKKYLDLHIGHKNWFENINCIIMCNVVIILMVIILFVIKGNKK